MHNQDIIKIRVHDGIVGLIYLVSVALADQFELVLFGLLLLQQSFKFYHLLQNFVQFIQF